MGKCQLINIHSILGIRHRKLQLEALQYLIQLLPPSNRDTLYALLNFLAVVAQHADDRKDQSGKIITVQINIVEKLISHTWCGKLTR